MNKTEYPITPIAYVSSPFKEKFGIPRQAGLATSTFSDICLISPYNSPQMVEGLETSSHIWVLFLFHQTAEQGWRSKVRPPRLGGNQKIGVLASRSPFRPNPIGLSVAKLECINVESADVRLRVSGLDLLDGTPVCDIKPYLPYCDAVTHATNTLAPAPAPLDLPVTFSPQALALLDQHPDFESAHLQAQLSQLLKCDPRPAYHQDNRRYGMRLHDLDIHWHVFEDWIEVVAIESAR